MAQVQSAAVRRNQNALKKAVAQTKKDLAGKKITKTVEVYPKGLWRKTLTANFKEARKGEKKAKPVTKKTAIKRKTTSKAKAKK